MKKPFLVVHDYGQGGVWAFIHARSREEIERRFPELDIVDEVPKWMSVDEVAVLEERMTFDLDKPRGWLAKVAVGHKGRDDDIAAGEPE